VAVIGAGMGGLTVAAALLKRGVNAQIFEQTAEFARIGAGIQVSANPMKVLRGLGLEEAVASRAFWPETYESRDGITGESTNTLTLGTEFAERYDARHVLMHRGDLHSLLASAVPKERVHLGKKFVSLDQTSRNVTVKFADGTSFEADAVIACDGVHSAIRKQLLGAEDAHYSGHISQRAVYPTSLLPADLIERMQKHHFIKWWGPDRHVVSYFVTSARDEVYFATALRQEKWETESWSALGDLGELRAAFAEFHPDIRTIIDRCPKVFKLAIFERQPLRMWSQGRVTLLGDAAHPMTPYMAQGAAQALEDAAVVTRCLTELDAGVEDALQIYQATRFERASRIQLISHKNTWLKYKEDSHWLYEYDAWTVPLTSPQTVSV
jgi:salicylate hydroxylase/6-hydroxynicotinate 3-monooxygenase